MREGKKQTGRKPGAERAQKKWEKRQKKKKTRENAQEREKKQATGSQRRAVGSRARPHFQKVALLGQALD